LDNRTKKIHDPIRHHRLRELSYSRLPGRAAYSLHGAVRGEKQSKFLIQIFFITGPIKESCLSVGNIVDCGGNI
jgi:hypothetical protein